MTGLEAMVTLKLHKGRMKSFIQTDELMTGRNLISTTVSVCHISCQVNLFVAHPHACRYFGSGGAPHHMHAVFAFESFPGNHPGSEPDQR